MEKNELAAEDLKRGQELLASSVHDLQGMAKRFKKADSAVP